MHDVSSAGISKSTPEEEETHLAKLETIKKQMLKAI